MRILQTIVPNDMARVDTSGATEMTVRTITDVSAYKGDRVRRRQLWMRRGCGPPSLFDRRYEKKNPGTNRGFLIFNTRGRLNSPCHPSPPPMGECAWPESFFGSVGDHRLRHDQQAGNRSRIL